MKRKLFNFPFRGTLPEDFLIQFHMERSNIMKMVLSFLVSCLIAVVFCACATGVSVAELNEADSGRTLTVEVGERFTVSLESNPTTGYQWRFAGPYDEEVLILCSDTFSNPTEKDVVGAPGRRNLTFAVVGPGRSGIRLEYKRPWERSAQPEKVFQLLVFATGEAEVPVTEEKEVITPRVGSKGQIVPPEKGVFD